MANPRKIDPTKMSGLELLEWVEQTSPRPGQRRNAASIEKARQTRLKTLAAQRAAKATPRPRRSQVEFFRLRHDAVRWRILRAMQPGAWYGTPDLAALVPDVARRISVRAIVLQQLWQPGWLERVRNPAYRDDVSAGRQSEPQWLYRLTERGERERAAWLLLD